MIQNFTDLLVWQRAIALGKEVYRLTKKFPATEKFGLALQVRRAAVSVSSNIAEGHARQGREFPHYLSIARGSSAEVHSQLLFACELGYVSRDDIATAVSLAEEIRKMSAVLAAKLRQSSS
jgi:four helix bundle protein